MESLNTSTGKSVLMLIISSRTFFVLILSSPKDYTYSMKYLNNIKKVKIFLYQAVEAPYGCETSRPPHFLDSWFIDDSELSALRVGRPLPPRKIRGTHFC
jgi:hypothetical protein